MERGQDWTIQDVRNWRELAEDPEEREVTTALAFALLGMGIGEVTEKTFSKVVTRLREMEEVNGFFLRWKAEDGSYPLVPIHSDAIYRRIGMRARVTPKNDQQFRAMIKRDRLQKELYEAERRGATA
jgi:hypothetical protein